MKKFCLLIFSLFFLKNFVIAQLPDVKWKRQLGGSYFNGVNTRYLIITDVARANNGSYIVVGYDKLYGYSDSVDAMVWCLSVNGNLMWQKKLGGSKSDVFYSVSKSADGNFVCVGSSNSINGNVVGNSNSKDAWLLKIDRFGNIIWSKSFGVNNAAEEGKLSAPTSDTGTVFVFNKQLTKIDKNGNVIWSNLPYEYNHNIKNIEEDKATLNLKVTEDSLTGLAQYRYFSNGWYNIFNGATGSLISSKIISSGTYKQFENVNNYVLLDQIDCPDCWLSSNANCGNINNQGYNPPYKSYAVSTSNTSYPLFEQHCIYGCGTPNLGPMILPQMPTSYENYPPSIISINDSTIILATDRSYPTVCSPTYDSTIHNFEAYKVLYNNGNVKYIPFTWTDYNYNLQYYNATRNFIGFNASTVSSSNEYNINHITGLVYNDADGNGHYDQGEKLFKHFKLKATNDTTQNTSYSSVDDTGRYVIETPETGKFTTTITNFSKQYWTFTPNSDTSVFTAEGRTDTINFKVEPIPNKTDLHINLWESWNVPRPGNYVSYGITLKNQGTTTPTGEVRLVKDSKQGFVSATPNYTSIHGDTLIWKYYGFDLDSIGFINVTLRIDTASIHLGQVISMYATATSTTTDETPYDNVSALHQTIRLSFDPNDKTENHNGTITTNEIAGNESLLYTIRFQNTGNDTAFIVDVKDKIDSKLDMSSFEMVVASHSYKLTITEGNKLEWKFDNILLVDSNHNEPASHGYIVYRIKPKSSLVHNDTIKNSADIYFDFNQPVKTNTEKIVVINTTLPKLLKEFAGELNTNKTVSLHWQMLNEYGVSKYVVEKSTDNKTYTTIATVPASKASVYKGFDEHPAKGINYYRLNIIEVNGKESYSNIVAIKLNDKSSITVYPNPATNQLTISRSVATVTNNINQVDVFDAMGKRVATLQLTSLQQTFDISGWAKGLYILSFGNGDKVKVIKE